MPMPKSLPLGVALVIALAGTGLTRSVMAQNSTETVTVLGLEPSPGVSDPIASLVTTALREEIKNKAGYQLGPVKRDLADIKAVYNCSSGGPDCMKPLGKRLHTDYLLY